MNANHNVMNDTFVSVAENMQARDAIMRLLLTAVLIGTLFIEQPVQYLGLIVVAITYLFTTAIMRWDPLYALFGLQRMNDQMLSSPKLSESSIINGVDRQDTSSAANDAYNSEKYRKKAG